jgi:hypothetical protein
MLPLQADWPMPMPAIGRIANFSSLKKNRPKEHQIIDSYFGKYYKSENDDDILIW